METPSQILADKIMERLVREGLVTAQAAKTMLPKLSEGKLLAEDWRLPIELGEKKEAKP